MSQQTNKDSCGQSWEVLSSHEIVSLLMGSLLMLPVLGVEKWLIQCTTDIGSVTRSNPAETSSHRESLKTNPNFDECTHQRGWFPVPDTLRSFRQCLCEAPDLSNKFLPCDIHTEALHLFTDGSCLRPQDPLLRIASWGVVCADVVNNSFIPIACGPLPGLHQTIFRAEALAAISALRFGKSRKVPFWLWVDNQRFFDILTECRVGSPRIFSLTDKDHDLCQILVDECRRAMGPGGFQTVVKVWWFKQFHFHP